MKRSVGPVSVACLALLLPFALGLVACFPRHAGPHLGHFFDVAPALGEPLPDLVLVDLDGGTVDLAELVAEGPVVLQLGSATCPVFRYRRHGIERLAEELGERVRLLVVYTREAHPMSSPNPVTGEVWDLWINRVTRVRLDDTTTTEERRQRAQETREKLGLVSVVLVDPEGNPGWEALGRAPSPAFVIDRQGRLAARQVWVDPQELGRILRELLEEEGT
jgi:hypothetical protein